MKKTDAEILVLVGVFSRLSQLPISSRARYAVTRNLQVLEPLKEATFKAFPPPTHPGKDATPEALKAFAKAETDWLASLPTDPREFKEFLFMEIPSYTDTLLASDLRKEGTSEDDILLFVARQDQAIMNGIRDFISEEAK